MYNYYGYSPYTHNPYGSYPLVYGDPYIRVFHASPDAPAVDVYVNNSPVATNLKYKQFTEYLPIGPGRYNIRVYPTGSRTRPIIDTDISAPQGSIFTLAAVGRLADISLLPIEEPKRTIPQGKLYIRFGHLSPNAPRVDVRLASGVPLFQSVVFKEITNYIPVDPGTYTINVFLAGTNERVLHVPNINLRANRFYTIYAVGLAGGTPSLQALIPLDGNSYLNV